MRMSQIIQDSSETDTLRQFASCKSKGKEGKQGKIGLGYDNQLQEEEEGVMGLI